MKIIASTMNYAKNSSTAGYTGRFTANGQRLTCFFKFSDKPESFGNVTMTSKVYVYNWFRFSESEWAEITAKLTQHYQVIHKGGIRLIRTLHHTDNSYTIIFEYESMSFRAEYDLDTGKFFLYRPNRLTVAQQSEIEWRIRAHFDVLNY